MAAKIETYATFYEDDWNICPMLTQL